MVLIYSVDPTRQSFIAQLGGRHTRGVIERKFVIIQLQRIDTE